MKMPFKKSAEKKRQDADNTRSASIVTDPFGSYTGVPRDPDDKPVQDADDL